MVTHKPIRKCRTIEERSILAKLEVNYVLEYARSSRVSFYKSALKQEIYNAARSLVHMKSI